MSTKKLTLKEKTLLKLIRAEINIHGRTKVHNKLSKTFQVHLKTLYKVTYFKSKSDKTKNYLTLTTKNPYDYIDKSKLLEICVDIETSHNEGKFFRPGMQYVSVEQITRERNIIMIQYAPLTARKLSDVTILKWDWKKWEDRDRKLLTQFSKLLNKYDRIRIYTKNGARFDWPWINGRLAMLGIEPLPPITMVDVEQLVRRNFGFNSYKLDYLDKIFGGTGKVPMVRQDWFDVENGCPKAMAKFCKYGPGDIISTINVLNKIKKYVPETRAYTNIRVDNGMCPHCKAVGNKNYLQKRGQVETLAGWKQKWYCPAKNHPKDARRWITDNRLLRKP